MKIEPFVLQMGHKVRNWYNKIVETKTENEFSTKMDAMPNEMNFNSSQQSGFPFQFVDVANCVILKILQLSDEYSD